MVFQKGNTPWTFKRHINNNKLALLYNSGYSVKEISEKINLNQDCIKIRLLKVGCKIRNCSEAQINAIRRGRKIPISGQNHYKWKGGRNKDSQGYIRITMPGGNPIREHILIWEKVHNKKTPKGYIIHHLNGIRDDNRPENLVAISRKDHPRLFTPYQERISQLEQEIRYLRDLIYRVKREE